MCPALDDAFRRRYDVNADEYDMRFRGEFAEEENRLILDLLKLKAEDLVLDVGTGTGRVSVPVAERSGARLYGLDLSTGMLHRAAANRDALGNERPGLVCGNARQLPFPDDTFDVVMSIRVLHLFPQEMWRDFIGEMLRVLKPSGILLVEFDSPLAGFGWALLRDVIGRRRGLKPRYYLWPTARSSLFADLEQVYTVGFWFPGIGRVARSQKKLRPALKFARIPGPLGYLNTHVLVSGRKPERTAERSGAMPSYAVSVAS